MKARIAEVKAKLSAYLRRVKAGEEITVFDREVPVARIVGIKTSPLSSRPPIDKRPPGQLNLSVPGGYAFDPVDTLVQDRRRDRLSR
ncbi:MAG: type II toxin-antitoxin system prevent-host-death family antitoxin [Deltaproteobacteria bacterium]|nr:type II toxin-antitoxin system prevent-host-death family antitoxin [Deltaproteobacteria bacterium]